VSAPKRPKHREVRLDDLRAVVSRAKTGALSADDCSLLEAAVDTLAVVTQELEAKGTSIQRLRKLIFGATTEKTSKVVGPDGGGNAPGSSSGSDDAGAAAPDAKDKPKSPGHGRNGAVAYRGAAKVKIPHPSLKPMGACPECKKGKVYLQNMPAQLLRVTGMAPLAATVYECERLRCNLCGDVFTAPSPAGVGDEKYDETAAAMVGMLKYGAGIPFYRLERLERSMGIPLPAATQWKIVHRAADLMTPAYAELVRQAAQGDVVHNDDTTATILDLDLTVPRAGETNERTGVFTTGIVSTGSGHRIALFFTGRKHAGENLRDLLSQRTAEMSPPIQMCDALSRNVPSDFDTIVANCIAHARRRFVDVVDNFPDEVRHVLESLREVYLNDATACERAMSAPDRLRFHQKQSGAVMGRLRKWCRDQFKLRTVEPNSTLGDAFSYLIKHWTQLTLFLRVAGAPLDNNICERALKKAILHRKNALFYKTENGARVGDLFMALIHTAELCDADPFEYMVALQRHHEQVLDEPSAWMPWNYADIVARLAPPGPAP
jgi:transposase